MRRPSGNCLMNPETGGSVEIGKHRATVNVWFPDQLTTRRTSGVDHSRLGCLRWEADHGAK